MSSNDIERTTETVGRGSTTQFASFIPGTRILTDHGEIPIEDLKEGDSVCTRLAPMQWGVKSSEEVKTHSPDLIWSINGEAPFFTASHVFHTTTGLRALDHNAARAENPWIEVAQLRVGHQLLQTTSNQQYQTVTITSIKSERSKHDVVYGLYLREGLRSYHANGYLVAFSHPELTASMMTGKRLMSLPAADRGAILRSSPELRQLVERFGASKMLEMLAREAESKDL